VRRLNRLIIRIIQLLPLHQKRSGYLPGGNAVIRSGSMTTSSRNNKFANDTLEFNEGLQQLTRNYQRTLIDRSFYK
jgi:hypothetical protein